MSAETKGAETATSSVGEKPKGRRKIREGVVVSDKMSKTIVVEVQRLVKHTQYGKYVRRTKRFYAHDEGNSCKVGDRVSIVESKPYSKLKRWELKEVVSAAEQLS